MSLDPALDRLVSSAAALLAHLREHWTTTDEDLPKRRRPYDDWWAVPRNGYPTDNEYVVVRQLLHSAMQAHQLFRARSMCVKAL